MDKDLSEMEELVMQAFSPANPAMCVHQLFMATGIPYDKLYAVVARMRRDEQLVRVVEAHGRDAQYTPLSLLGQAQRWTHGTDRCGLMVGLTEAQMSARVAMLRRMKRLLIVDWHPTIDVLLGDYERNLKLLYALREPVDMRETMDDCFVEKD